MRTAKHKIKVSFAIKHMSKNDQQQSIQLVNHHQNMPILSIINIHSCQHTPQPKMDRNRKNINFSTLTGPHRQQRTKTLQYQTTIKLAEKQKTTSKSKSQRIKPLYVKNLNSSPRRINNPSLIMKRCQGELWLNQSKSKLETECQAAIRKRGNEIFIKDDASLKLQNGKQPDSPQETQQKRKSYTQSQVYVDNDSSATQNHVKERKLHFYTQSKETLKNKQSRKHIHRVLKQKSQTITRHKPKSNNVQISKDVLQSCGISQIYNLSAIHYGLTKNNIKHFCLSNLKKFNSPCLDLQQDLKIQAKAAEIINSKLSQEVITRDIYNNRPQYQKFKSKKGWSSFSIRKQNRKEQDQNLLIRRGEQNKQKQMDHFSAQKESRNFFLLTPWHQDGPQ